MLEDQDHSVIPYEASWRVQAPKDAGVKVVGTIVAHDAPRLLAGPVASAFQMISA